MPEDYASAAIRHFKDATALQSSGRLDNAGHLVGFAAECAIKHGISNLRSQKQTRRTATFRSCLSQPANKSARVRSAQACTKFSKATSSQDGASIADTTRQGIRVPQSWRVVLKYQALARHGKTEGARVTEIICFDDSFPAFARLVKDAWGSSALEENMFLRDASGRLTLVLLTDSKTPDQRSAPADRAVLELGAYVDKGGFAIATPEELLDDTINLASSLNLRIRHKLFDGSVHLADRRRAPG